MPDGRVFIFGLSDAFGGGEALTVAVACALAATRDVVLVTRPDSPTMRAGSAAGLATTSLDLGPKLGRRTALRSSMRFAFARRALFGFFDAHTSMRDWCVLQYKWEELLWGGSPVPPWVCVWEHGPIPPLITRVPYARARLVRTFRNADLVLAWSAPAAASICELTGVQSVRVDAGVDAQAVAEAVVSRESYRDQLLDGRPATGVVVAYVGRLAEDKGIDALTRAMPLIPNATLLLAGDGPARQQLIRLCRALGIANRVLFLGHVDRPLAVLAAADVSVLLSSSPGEGRPLSVIESAAVGTPVVGAARSNAIAALASEGLASGVTDISPECVASAIVAAACQPRELHSTPSWDEVGKHLGQLLADASRVGRA